ncbi:uncharacterized protein [Leuresthes tenuis]|uniref:uncharacterized protein n=1 Tax=Leuresthes tenuis TaxID=355514 RepID=UPI003B507895
MYQQHSQQQGSQPYPNAPMPSHHQSPANQHPNRSSMQAMAFQFPRPTQLPDELESALAIRGARDMDHRQLDHMSQPNQGSGSGIGQHGGFGPNPVSLPADNQPGQQQGVDWSSYQPPTKLFASPPPNAGHQGTQQQPQSRQSHVGGGGGEGQSLYTPESAGSILASFGLSNDDLEVLSHYPDDQLTPDTLPFILRDIQINKSGNKKTVASSSSFSRSIRDMPAPPSCTSRSPEVPSLLTVTQTAGKVIDYGHASRGQDDSNTRETFKREPLSSERTVKMYPAVSSSTVPKVDETERRQVRLEHKEPNKHGDRDYRRTSSEKHKSSRSPGREFPRSPKSRNLDRDYRHEGSKPRPSSETRSEASSRRSVSSSSGSRPHGSSKKLPTPTMISDFAAVSPKVYPHTCSLCNIQCDQDKDWIEHINTVDHTAACRDLRNKYPGWRPNLPSRSGRYGSRALWDPKDGSPFHSASRSLSRSPSPSQGRHRVDSHPHRPHGRPYSTHHHPRSPHYTERSHRFAHHNSNSQSPYYTHRTASSSRENWPERRNRGPSGDYSRSGVKRPYEVLSKNSADVSQNPASSATGHGSKQGPSQPSTKSIKGIMSKPATRTPKMSIKPPPAKKKKKTVTPASQHLSVADRLVYLTGIPQDASEQEVTDLVGSFGKINNVILMPCSEEECEKGQGQKASVCMVRAEDAQALASSPNLCIRDQEITATGAKKAEDGQSSDANSKLAPEQDRAGKHSGIETDKTEDQKCKVLITGLPETGWSESDIIQLVQPYGSPSDIILATHTGKALVSLPDLDVAQELVKVHSFKPASVNDSEVKISLLNQHISLSTPVALYNLLMGSVDPLESSALVGWSSLLVIRNVPDTVSASSEVLKLVRRFGTVIKTLVLNNMVVCEMATAAMALSVYKRFQMFPCIIQNNPLFFSRKPDPKPNPQSKVIAAYQDSSEDKPANGENQTAAAAEEEVTAHEANSESSLEGLEKDGDENIKSTEKTAEGESLGENDSKDESIKKRELFIPGSSADADLVTEMRGTLAVEAETAEVKAVVAAEMGSDTISVGVETKPPTSDGSSASQETAMLELPKMTQAMVNALLVECRTRTSSHPNNATAHPTGEEEEAQMETEPGDKAAEETKKLAKSSTGVEEEELKKQEKEREARKERERREKEKRAKREKERAEKARREKERRECDRRERERRERKRAYGEGLSGSRSSYRSEGYRQSSWRDERASVEAETKKEDEDFEEFPFNLSDFVTVDEVGDVTDLPLSPSPTVPMETSEEADGAPKTGQQDAPEDTPTEAPVTLAESDEQTSKSQDANLPMADTSNGLTLPDLTPLDLITGVSCPHASQLDCSLGGTLAPACHPEPPQADVKPEPETTADSTPDVHPFSVPAPAESTDPSSNSPDAVTVGKEDGKESVPVNPSQANDEEVVELSQKQEELEQDEDSKEMAGVAGGARELQKAEDHSNSQEETIKTELKMETHEPLPPYDPSKPVGLEYLVPKTGFFCKVCSRFFSGAKVAEINHCKTFKHYENLQKFLQNTKH